MATDNGVKSSGLRLEVKILEIVKHVKMEAGGFDYGRKRKLLCPRLNVHVAAHRKNGSDELELREDLRRAYISRVKDKLNTLQRAQRFGAEQAVSIGNDADPQGRPTRD